MTRVFVSNEIITTEPGQNIEVCSYTVPEGDKKFYLYAISLGVEPVEIGTDVESLGYIWVDINGIDSYGLRLRGIQGMVPGYPRFVTIPLPAGLTFEPGETIKIECSPESYVPTRWRGMITGMLGKPYVEEEEEEEEEPMEYLEMSEISIPEVLPDLQSLLYAYRIIYDKYMLVIYSGSSSNGIAIVDMESKTVSTIQGDYYDANMFKVGDEYRICCTRNVWESGGYVTYVDFYSYPGLEYIGSVSESGMFTINQFYYIEPYYYYMYNPGNNEFTLFVRDTEWNVVSSINLGAPYIMYVTDDDSYVILLKLNTRDAVKVLTRETLEEVLSVTYTDKMVLDTLIIDNKLLNLVFDQSYVVSIDVWDLSTQQQETTIPMDGVHAQMNYINNKFVTVGLDLSTYQSVLNVFSYPDLELLDSSPPLFDPLTLYTKEWKPQYLGFVHCNESYQPIKFIIFKVL